MPGINPETLPEKVLLAAAQLESQGQTPFSAEALIVTAWQRYPRTFGLKGYEEQYPDSNKVLAAIMGEKGLPRRGWLSKVGQKLYALTQEGTQLAARLLQGEPVPARAKKASPIGLPRDHDVLLQRLLAGPVYLKFRADRAGDWTFGEACRFWALEDRAGEAIDERLEEVEEALKASEGVLARGGVALGNGRHATAREVGDLLDIHQQLARRFDRHLGVLRHRAARA